MSEYDGYTVAGHSKIQKARLRIIVPGFIEVHSFESCRCCLVERAGLITSSVNPSAESLVLGDEAIERPISPSCPLCILYIRSSFQLTSVFSGNCSQCHGANSCDNTVFYL